MSTSLSININKYALLRNSRGHDLPNLLQAANVCIAAGCQGITVHPRWDERHVRLDDVPLLSEYLNEHHPKIEFNIECENRPELIEMVQHLRPHQCTLVPVTPGEVTSDHGWDLPRESTGLIPVIARLRAEGIRVSLFADCSPAAMPYFAQVGADRVELYTGPYAWAWATDSQEAATTDLWKTARAARAVGLGVNAGHDLDRHNLAGVKGLDLHEVSIGHAQICRALEVGTTKSVQELLAAL
ncbi:MAG: pyridoxine 5'-phosphate synthase [Rhodobacterales bacterium]|nr:pyridoxine 5'-phosphate synthase [Rhodobacterales bacterium]